MLFHAICRGSTKKLKSKKHKKQKQPYQRSTTCSSRYITFFCINDVVESRNQRIELVKVHCGAQRLGLGAAFTFSFVALLKCRQDALKSIPMEENYADSSVKNGFGWPDCDSKPQKRGKIDLVFEAFAMVS